MNNVVERAWLDARDVNQVYMKLNELLLLNIARGNVEVKEDSEGIISFSIPEGKDIQTKGVWEISKIGLNFLNEYREVKDFIQSDNEGFLTGYRYCMIRNGKEYSIYKVDHNNSYETIIEGNASLVSQSRLTWQDMSRGEFEFLRAQKGLARYEWSYKTFCEIDMRPDELVKALAGSQYDSIDDYGYVFRIVDEPSQQYGMLRGEKYYDSFKSIQQIADENGINYRECFINNLTPQIKECIMKVWGGEISTISTDSLHAIIDESYSGEIGQREDIIRRICPEIKQEQEAFEQLSQEDATILESFCSGKITQRDMYEGQNILSYINDFPQLKTAILTQRVDLSTIDRIRHFIRCESKDALAKIQDEVASEYNTKMQHTSTEIGEDLSEVSRTGINNEALATIRQEQEQVHNKSGQTIVGE